MESRGRGGGGGAAHNHTCTELERAPGQKCNLLRMLAPQSTRLLPAAAERERHFIKLAWGSGEEIGEQQRGAKQNLVSWMAQTHTKPLKPSLHRTQALSFVTSSRCADLLLWHPAFTTRGTPRVGRARYQSPSSHFWLLGSHSPCAIPRVTRVDLGNTATSHWQHWLPISAVLGA